MEQIEKIPADNLVVSYFRDSISSIMEKINNNQLKSTIVVDDVGTLVGSISDGDIRRGLLDGKTLEQDAASFMNSEPVRVYKDANLKEIHSLFDRFAVSILPVIDEMGKVIFCYVVRKFRSGKDQKCSALIMAGGKGSRLASVLENLPKPLLNLGTGQTIVEILIEKLVFAGIKEIYISVNHLANEIIQYIGDGSIWNCKINYIVENSPLGTAGSIFLLPKSCLKNPIIVLNADLIITDDFGYLLSQHLDSKRDLSIVTKEYEIQLQYGVVDKNFEISEKPKIVFNILSGIYIFSKVPKGPDEINPINMIEFLQICKDDGFSWNEIKLLGDWMDIGTIENYSKIRMNLRSI